MSQTLSPSLARPGWRVAPSSVWKISRERCFGGSTTVQPSRGCLQGRSASTMTLSGAPGPGSLTVFSDGSVTILAP